MPRNLNGERIGPFKVVRQISNHGGMAGVYEGTISYAPSRERNGSRVALKISYTDDSNTDIFEEMLVKETQLLHNFRHPGIVRLMLIEMGEDSRKRLHFGRARDIDGMPFYFAMELLQGGTLADIIGKRGFDLSWKVELIYQLAITLHYLHSSGLAHRDLKPENIMFRTSPDPRELPQPILIDFGLAEKRRVNPEVNAATIRYAAPERVQHLITQKAHYEPTRDVTDHSKADVWALGVIAWELFADSYPFQHIKNRTALADSIVRDRPRISKGNIPPRLQKLLAVMLAKDWQKRFTIDEIINVLETDIENLAPRLDS
ncbi:MAG: serine/threonine protein kinase [Anaerolineae bacterium]|nr:serine/threonine protein kinase [Anaerolineae bacterium]